MTELHDASAASRPLILSLRPTKHYLTAPPTTEEQRGTSADPPFTIRPI